MEKAWRVAKQFGIPRAYGSFEEALADPEVEAIYNPLPNHLHVPWSIRAAEAGKHILCEKPVAMGVDECRKLIAARERTGLKIGEAFMARSHRQWLRARELARSGEIGDLWAVMVAFSYFNCDPANIRHVPEFGGGAVMEFGCYLIQISRFLFSEEPVNVVARLERDPEFHTDRLVSAVLDFPSGHAVFTCATQMVYHQRAQILGTKGRVEVEVEVSFNALPDRKTHLVIDSSTDLYGGGLWVEGIRACHQYGIQGDLFSRGPRHDRGADAARGFDPEHGRHRGRVEIGTDRTRRHADLVETVITTLPTKSPLARQAYASAASSKGNTLSTIGLIWLTAMA